MKAFSGFNNLSFKVVCGVIATLVVITGIFFYFFYRLHRQQLISSLKESTSHLASLIETNLEHAMLTRDLALLSKMVITLGQEPGVQGVAILDGQSMVRVSSYPEVAGKVLDQKDTGCRECHALPPERRSNTAIVTSKQGKKLFRNMMPIFNKPQCFDCHDPSNRINGVLLMDFSMEPIERHLSMNVKEMFIWVGSMVSATILVIIILMNKLVLKKIKLFVRKTQLIGQGHMDERVNIPGKDEISELGGHFNKMAESLKESIGRLKEHKEYLENLLNSIDDGVVVIDRDYRIVLANTAFLSKFDLSREKSLGASCQNHGLGRIFPCGPLNSMCPMRETFRTGSSCKTLLSFKGNDERENCIEIYSSPIFNDSGELLQGVEVWRDITERRQLEAKLSHSERLASLGVMASGLAHEINNPLASISACIEGIQRRLNRVAEFDWEKHKDMEEYFKLILKEIQRSKETTQRLLILSRKSPLSCEPIDVNVSLKETISLLRHEAEVKNISILEDYGGPLPLIKGDEPQIRQVFLNIARNGIQAMGQDGLLKVSTNYAGGAIHVIFEDTGCGLAEEEVRRIFEPFFSKRDDGKGTGLGLFIADSIVKRHNGEIRIESRLGVGSKFTVLFFPERMEVNEFSYFGSVS